MKLLHFIYHAEIQQEIDAIHAEDRKLQEVSRNRIYLPKMFLILS